MHCLVVRLVLREISALSDAADGATAQFGGGADVALAISTTNVIYL